MKPLPQWARVQQRALETATLCATCGKKTLVANVSPLRVRPTLEPVTAATHCTCPGGPAAEISHVR